MKKPAHGTPGGQSGWRQFQEELQGISRRGTGRRAPLGNRNSRLLVLLALAILAFEGLWYFHPPAVPLPEAGPPRTEVSGAAPADEITDHGPALVGEISPALLTAATGSSVRFAHQGQPHTAFLTFDKEMEARLESRLDTRYSVEVAMAAVEPASGKVVVLTGWDGKSVSRVPAFSHLFPAASVFKIVTAAAAMEKCGVTPDSEMSYIGRQHTLYRSQIKEGRQGNEITFSDSFAHSVNPVFGKLGCELGAQTLAEFAGSFGFNRAPSGPLEVTPSVFQAPDTPFAAAEVGSGFNRRTRITALHGALLAAAVLNGGAMPEPVFVERVESASGKVVFRAPSRSPTHPACQKETADRLRDLMAKTVESGTARRPFLRARQDVVLKNLVIGAKTGSLNNDDGSIRYDWFVGFAEEKSGERKLAVAVLAAHGEMMGTRSGEYARLIIRSYFEAPKKSS